MKANQAPRKIIQVATAVSGDSAQSTSITADSASLICMVYLCN